MSFERENQVYLNHLGDLLGVNHVNEGKYAVIKGDHIAGSFDSYIAALRFGYATYGLTPFLVKKIERIESAYFFSREIV